jgi:leader peptidase (prepilin peptidase)/N-methyltransferase
MIFLLCIAGILGAILGSFASAVLPRIHEKRGFVQERSECPSCHAPLKVLDLFPIFSYLFLGGKCRYCKHAIPPYHFMLEVSMVLMFLGIAWFFGETTPLPSLVFLFAAGFVTIAFCAYDLLYMEIPDGFLLPFLLITFILLAVGNFETLPLFQHFIPFENPTLNSPLVQ